MNLIPTIHHAFRELGITEEGDQRAIYFRATRQTSLRAMTERQKLAVVEELKRLGFKVRPGKKTAAKLDKIRPAANRPHCRYIHALWGSCVKLGVINDASIKAKNAFCKKFVAPHDDKIAVEVDFLSKDQADPIIAALKAMEKRGKAPRL